MRRVIVFLIIMSLVAVTSSLSSTRTPGANKAAAAPQQPTGGRQLIVGYKPGTPPTRYHPTATDNCIAVKSNITAISVSLVEVMPNCSTEEVSQGMSTDSNIAYVEPNTLFHAVTPLRHANSNMLMLSPNDPFFSQQWNLAAISAPPGWDVFPGSFDAAAGAPIAIVDTGIDGLHPDFQGKILKPASFVDNGGALVDDVGHGTATASTALAAANNGFGIAGVAFNSPVIPAKVATGLSTSVFDIANGIQYAADPAGGGAKVINVSFGGPTASQTLFRAIDFARIQGALVTVSAGNCGDATSPVCEGEVNSDKWPAAFSTSLDNIIAVAATNENDQRAPFSNFGNFITVAAPGTDILVDSPSDPSGVTTEAGTSFSAPEVAGLAALLFSQNPARSYQDVKALIQQSADKVGGQPFNASGRNDFLGFGRINVLAALQQGAGPPTPASGADGKIEVVFPHDQSGNARSVTDAPLVNIQAFVFSGGGLHPVACGGGPTLQLWRALNNQPAQMVGQTSSKTISANGLSFPSWEFNNVDVSAAQDPANKYYFFLRAPGQAGFRTNVWTHGADARTIFPNQDVPTSVATQQPTGPLDGKIEIVFTHDAAGNPQPITQAPLANLAVDLFNHGTLQSVPLSFSQPVRIIRKLNNNTVGVVIEGQRTTVTTNGITYPQWIFNDVDVSAAQNPSNKYFFSVDVDFTNIWAHGSDARTIFPQKDVPTASGQECQ